MPWLALLIPIVTIVAVFTFVAIASWSDNRRKERETYYRHETYRKIMEHPGESAQAVARLMHQEEAQQQRSRVEGLRLGGLITLAAGIGATIFLYHLIDEEPIYLAGTIAVAVGLVLTLYGFLLAEKPAGTDKNGSQ